MKKALIGMLALALFAVTAGASASPSGGKGMRGDAPRLSRLQDLLDLSDAQAAEIREIRANGGSRDDVRAVLSEEQRTMLDTHRARRQGHDAVSVGFRAVRPRRAQRRVALHDGLISSDVVNGNSG